MITLCYNYHKVPNKKRVKLNNSTCDLFLQCPSMVVKNITSELLIAGDLVSNRFPPKQPKPLVGELCFTDARIRSPGPKR